MVKVYRRQRIEGVNIPAIIHNGGYFLIQMPVYEDGIVSCWHKSDLQQLQDDLRRGWITPGVPLGKELSVHNLGSFEVREARWDYDIQSYYQHVREVVQSLNPEMVNLYQTTPRELEKWDRLRIRWSADATPCKQKPGFGYDFWDGESSYIFCRQNDRLRLTPLTVFADKTVLIEALAEQYYNMEEIEQLFARGVLCTEPDGAEWVSLPGLGSVLLCGKLLSAADKLGEIRDVMAALAGEDDSINICRRAYHYYLEEPSDWARENLRQKYEAVPEHQRIYLGDMDTRDSDYQRILYHPEQKREV